MKKELIKYTIFGIIIIVLITYFKQCSEPEYITEIDTILITSIKTQLIPVAVSYPVLSEVEKIIYKNDTILQIDTITKYITNYLAKNTFKDTILNSDSGFIAITDIIHRNLIESRTSEIKLYNKNTIIEKDLSIIGGAFYISDINMSSVGLTFGLIDKKNMYEIGLGTNQTYLFKYSRVLFSK